MKIGQIAQRTGTTTRQLRYYEQQGLISARRTASNYRDYDESTIETVFQIRRLIDSGMSTRVIAVLLPCVQGPGAELPHHDNPEMAGMLVAEKDRVREQIEKLMRTESEIQCYLDRVGRAQRRAAAS